MLTEAEWLPEFRVKKHYCSLQLISPLSRLSARNICVKQTFDFGEKIDGGPEKS